MQDKETRVLNTEYDVTFATFTLYRVGFSSKGNMRVVYIDYSGCCGYYLLFQYKENSWQRQAYDMSYVV